MHVAVNPQRFEGRNVFLALGNEYGLPLLLGVADTREPVQNALGAVQIPKPLFGVIGIAPPLLEVLGIVPHNLKQEIALAVRVVVGLRDSTLAVAMLRIGEQVPHGQADCGNDLLRRASVAGLTVEQNSAVVARRD